MLGKAVLGIDVGGTFTDLALVTADGSVRVHKVLNDRGGADAAVLGAVEITDTPQDVAAIVHGTTVATNAVLERTGATTVLATTHGFRDVLELQRQDRLDVWDLAWRKPTPLVPRHLRVEVDERLGPDGEVLRSLDAAAADQVLAVVDAAGADAVAICFLHAYRDGRHERELAEQLRARRPGLHVSQSHRVAAQFREYDRMSTTALNAYLSPVLGRHLGRFDEALTAAGFGAAEVLVMQSNGGVVPLAAASDVAASMCLSGPAGGVLAAAEIARGSGTQDLLCLDMGGTSTDVALVRGKVPEVSYDSVIDGLPTVLPMFRIETVGAGGGSIVAIDESGLLQVGPRSAGATPGPACYGNGGTLATVTDAWCALGVVRDDVTTETYLRPDRAAATAAVAEVAAALGTSVEDAAWQALRVTTANMSRALRLVTVEQGHDPRSFTLVAYGGAGGLHAALCAQELGIERVLVPMNAGVFSAYGMVCADVVRDYVQTSLMPLSEQAQRAASDQLHAMADRARVELAEYGIPQDPQLLARIDMRYEGQAHDVPVSVDLGQPPDVDQLRAAFDRNHETRYGFSEPSTPVEIVNLRLEARSARPAPALREIGVRPAVEVRRTVWLGSEQGCRFIDRDAMVPDQVVMGPAVVEESTSTTVVPAGWQAHRDSTGQLWLGRA